ncbi:MAG TPA: Crp/Fnr family transcriptional regulator [Amycolatopsis sp.]|uniref:Crp/Fnr family transcriptional regulator n=1 Tax=Amycolatopsis nalaikhensis TaxID=715472 RepID=A0ABY8XZ83_9PSEU|nr:Crp/Fnr family transcriptional regulator [Amycolatopsis sp. 2-2]WIV61025.1 Crp/Fnr family transcriptional regulator [Amycolatopsis sp. 2-2]
MTDKFFGLARTAFDSAGKTRKWAAGQILVRYGDRTDQVILVKSGQVKVSSSAPTGKQVVLAVRGPGDLLGELSVIDGRPRSAQVTALSAVTAITLDGARFRSLLIADGAAAFRLLEIVVGRLREADLQRLEYGAYPVHLRVARLLTEYATTYGRAAQGQRGTVIMLPLTQSELAEAAGASREAVAKALRRLRELGAISTARKQIVVLRPDLLARIADGSPSVYSDADGQPPAE